MKQAIGSRRLDGDGYIYTTLRVTHTRELVGWVSPRGFCRQPAASCAKYSVCMDLRLGWLPDVFASSEGELYTAPCRQHREWKKLKPSIHRTGYWRFKVRNKTLQKDQHISVHRYVCWAFHGPPEKHQTVVRHLDHNKLNNRPGNLAWGTVAENQEDERKRRKLLAPA